MPDPGQTAGGPEIRNRKHFPARGAHEKGQRGSPREVPGGFRLDQGFAEIRKNSQRGVGELLGIFTDRARLRVRPLTGRQVLTPHQEDEQTVFNRFRIGSASSIIRSISALQVGTS